MDDTQLLRYSRQILLPQVDVSGQEKLLGSNALIVGLGGLGSPIAMYLAAAGIGRLTLVDYDKVDLSNLQRQIVHNTERIGEPKTESAAHTLRTLNPDIRIRTIAKRLDEPALTEQAHKVDILVDASDNFDTRFLLNRVSVATGTPLVSGAVIRMEGQVAVFDPRVADSPCYRCLYGEAEAVEERCSETGILAPVPGIIGTIQATEAIKVLLGIGENLAGRLLLLDALSMEWRTLRLKKDPACPVCAP
jgi:molybdopterin/thiamine biosynthesis adenylyltransferase